MADRSTIRTRRQTRAAIEDASNNSTASGSTATAPTTTSSPVQTPTSAANAVNLPHTDNVTTGAAPHDTNNGIAPPPYSPNAHAPIPAAIYDHIPLPRNTLAALTTFYDARYLARRTPSPPSRTPSPPSGTPSPPRGTPSAPRGTPPPVSRLNRIILFLQDYTEAVLVLCEYLLFDDPVWYWISIAHLVIKMALHARAVVAGLRVVFGRIKDWFRG